MGFRLRNVFRAAVAIAVAVVAPTFATAVGEAIGLTGTAATAAGTAAISSGAALATGATPEQAIKAGIASGTAVGVGTMAGGGVAGGAAGSAAGAAVAGGSGQQILTNALAGGIGTAVGEYTSPSVGNAVKTFVATGDPNAALMAGITSQAASEIRSSMNQPTTTAAAPSGTQVAAADTGTVSDTPTQVGISGVPIYAESPNASSVNLPEGTRLMSAKEADERPLGSYYDPALNAWLVTERIFSGEGPGAGPGSTKSPGFLTSTPGDYTAVVGRGGRGGPSASVAAPTTGLPGVSVTGQREPSLGSITVTDKREPYLGEVTVTGERETTEPTTEFPGFEPGATDPTRTTPFTTSTTVAKKRPPQSVLAQAIRADFSPLSTTGLTAIRPAGEIESEETGKRREDVWNEASLRLKDALGL